MRRLGVIISTLLAMSGRVTMLGISRWAGQGGSYPTVQRFFYTRLPWPILFWAFFCCHCLRRAHTYLIAGDEVVVTKSGKKTYGLGRFFSSLYHQPVSALAFFNLALVSVQQRKAFPLQLEQRLPANNRPQSESGCASTAKRKRGRPKGSKNKDKTQVVLNPELQLIKGMLVALLGRLKGVVSVSYLLLDGAYGNNYALQMASQVGLHLISKLRYDAQLYEPYSGSDKRRKYGQRLNPRQMPASLRVSCEIDSEQQLQTEIYQLQALSPAFAQALNVVIILKTHLKTQQQVHVILFSSDLELSCETLIDYYALRFQIEFNFRDAKQFWGLEDFMNVSSTAVTNAANLSLFMVNFSERLLRDARQANPEFTILDLKAGFRGHRYVEEVLKYLPKKPDPILLATIFAKIFNLGAIHPVPTCNNAL